MKDRIYSDHVVNGQHYDVLIIGGGMSGALIANELRNKGKKILVLEAGLVEGLSETSYQAYLSRFYTQEAKVPNSPYPNNCFAPQPNVMDIEKILPNKPDTKGYFVQKGPLPFSSTNTRSLGGTTLHWLGVCLRMLPNDFKMESCYQRGVDWPIDYWDLKPFYEQAELEIGVSADTADLKYPGAGPDFFGDYDFPMHKIPPNYLDTYLAKQLEGMRYIDDEEEIDVDVVSIPQGRNSNPNVNYIDPRTGKPYVPRGSVSDPYTGQRCEGNSNCIPICPVQAKYNALKTLQSALQSKNVEVQAQCVVSKFEFDENANVLAVRYKHYVKAGDRSGITEGRITADTYVLAASAIENAKIMLASKAQDSSGSLACNLMDHPYLLTWSLLPDHIGPFRGPFTSSGIPSFRDGRFRNKKSAFRTDIGNWGWNFPTGAPYSDVANMVDQRNLFGKDLRNKLHDTVQRQMRFGFLIEQLPSKTNCITIDPSYLDDLGNFRPIIQYDLGNYEKAGFALAKEFSDQVYQRLGAEQYTTYSPSDPGFVKYGQEGFTFHGSGHIVGTHKMGNTKFDGVVTPSQQCFEHPNLYLVGCGSMPTIGTSNPTLTMAALALKTSTELSNKLR